MLDIDGEWVDDAGSQPGDLYFYVFKDGELKNDPGLFDFYVDGEAIAIITRKNLWDSMKEWDDGTTAIAFDHPGIFESMENVYECVGTPEEARQRLLSLGLIENKSIAIDKQKITSEVCKEAIAIVIAQDHQNDELGVAYGWNVKNWKRQVKIKCGDWKEGEILRVFELKGTKWLAEVRSTETEILSITFVLGD